MYDKRARDILILTFWSGAWKSKAERVIDNDDLAYAKNKGYMFDARMLSHDQTVSQLLEIRDQTDRHAVSDAFVASLGSRRLDLRSALGSYAFALNFPAHQIKMTPTRTVPSGAQHCRWCGFYEFDNPKEVELSILNFERHKWGGTRRDDPVYVWLDLSLFKADAGEEPTNADKQILREILEAARSIEPNATVGILEKKLAAILKSSKAERRILIEILAICGVLQPRGRSGYFGEFTMACEREHTGQHFNDWGYPAIWWRGADGVNETAVAAWFPDL